MIATKHIALVFLVMQNTALAITGRLSLSTGGAGYIAASAVVVAELLKAVVALGMMYYEYGSQMPAKFRERVFGSVGDFCKMVVPSSLYVLQNNLQYVAMRNLEAAHYQIGCQLKILTTAIFTVVILRRQLSMLQWIALLLLMPGISLVQLSKLESMADEDHVHVAGTINVFKGTAAVVSACVCSGLAGVYFEKVLKGTVATIWERNVQLGSIGVISGLVALVLTPGAVGRVRDEGFLTGYNVIVWTVVALQAFGGLVTAVVVKYADNIIKSFATSFAIILSCVIMWLFMDFRPSFKFAVGVVLVNVAVYIYGNDTNPCSRKPADAAGAASAAAAGGGGGAGGSVASEGKSSELTKLVVQQRV
jgi:UDP-sugar transporter A1/2/3